MSIDITQAHSISRRHWEFDLTDAPEVHFSESQVVTPYRGTVTEETRNDTRTVCVSLTHSTDGKMGSRRFVATTDPYFGWTDWDQPLSSLPADFLAELLDLCGIVSVPEQATLPEPTNDPCRMCGTWECASCGHKRPGLDRYYTGQHGCTKCQSIDGQMLPMVHRNAKRTAWHNEEAGRLGTPPYPLDQGLE